jgi:hypothetical protein
MNRFASALLAFTATLLSMTGPSFAKNPFTAPTFWHEKKQGWCLSIDKAPGPLQGSDECVQISGSMSKRDPITGYYCEEQGTVGFFSDFAASDNSIRPEFYVGRYTDSAMTLQYCFRPSNDPELEFDCKNVVTFESADKCPGG